MNKYDTIIIGGGLGGLLSAYILAKEGQKVCVLEQHHTVGGCLQSFKRKDLIFDTGVHYVGGLDEGQVLYKYFKYFGLINDTKFKRLDTDCFDKVNYKNIDYNFAIGYDNFKDSLIQKFPKEKVAITNYVKKIREIEKVFPLHNLQPMKAELTPMEVLTLNAKDFIASLTKNKDLQNVLAGTNALYAGVADKSPFYMHALILGSFIESSYRFINGSQQIADSLVKSIKKFGGEVFANKKVKEILTIDNIAKDAVTFDDDVFSANNFISAIHPATTNDMIKTNVLKKAYRNRIANLENTSSMFVIYAKLKKDKIKYLNYNYYKIYATDVWTGYDYNDSNWPKGYLYITPSHTVDDKYAKSLTILTNMNYIDFKKWENTSVKKRGDDYIKYKEMLAQKILKKVDSDFPGTIDAIDSYYTSTPLTYRDYTGTPQGSIYGIQKDNNNPFHTFVSPTTKIKNLFLTGQNLNMHGVLGVTISSVVTCSKMLGLEYLLNKIKSSN